MSDEPQAGETKAAVKAFLSGLDSNSRSRLKAIGVSAFNEYATDLPGPDAWVKDKARPYLETFLDNLINDWCS